MVNDYVEANHFTLSGADTQVTYDATSFSGVPLLQYEGPAGARSFEDKELSRTATALGEEVTATLKAVIDGDTVTVTLVVPQVRLDGGEPQPVSTFLVVTTNRSSLAGPPVGAGQRYEVVPLEGEARSVKS